jgi:6,7-dimethyl-8-ribityllumazine synthase
MALSANPIFTTEGNHQALARMSIKDAEAAEVAVQMHPLIKSLQKA